MKNCITLFLLSKHLRILIWSRSPYELKFLPLQRISNIRFSIILEYWYQSITSRTKHLRLWIISWQRCDVQYSDDQSFCRMTEVERLQRWENTTFLDIRLFNQFARWPNFCTCSLALQLNANRYISVLFLISYNPNYTRVTRYEELYFTTSKYIQFQLRIRIHILLLWSMLSERFLKFSTLGIWEIEL